MRTEKQILFCKGTCSGKEVSGTMRLAAGLNISNNVVTWQWERKQQEKIKILLIGVKYEHQCTVKVYFRWHICVTLFTSPKFSSQHLLISSLHFLRYDSLPILFFFATRFPCYSSLFAPFLSHLCLPSHLFFTFVLRISLFYFILFSFHSFFVSVFFLFLSKKCLHFLGLFPPLHRECDSQSDCRVWWLVRCFDGSTRNELFCSANKMRAVDLRQ